MMIKKTLATGIAVFALAGGMAACSEDEEPTESMSNSSQSETTEDASEGAATEETPAEPTEEDGSVDSAGDASVTVDGKPLEGLDLSTVTCVKQGGKITIGSASVEGQQGIGAILTDEAEPKIEAVSLVVDGVALAVTQASGVAIGSAEVSVDGDTYTITGEAEGADLADPTAGSVTKSFEIVVTCS